MRWIIKLLKLPFLNQVTQIGKNSLENASTVVTKTNVNLSRPLLGASENWQLKASNYFLDNKQVRVIATNTCNSVYASLQAFKPKTKKTLSGFIWAWERTPQKMVVKRLVPKINSQNVSIKCTITGICTF